MFFKITILLLILSISCLSMAKEESKKIYEKINLDLLNSNLKYIDNLFGPAIYSTEINEKLFENSYLLGDCKILVGIENTKVKYFGVNEITEKCSIGIYDLINDGYSLNLEDKKDEEITLGDIYSAIGSTYYIDCFKCGAYKADPNLILSYEGGRAHRNFLEITVSSSTVHGNNYDMFFKVKDYFKKKYNEDWLMDSFNCSSSYDEKSELINRYLKNIHIDSFFIGYETTERYEIERNCK